MRYTNEELLATLELSPNFPDSTGIYDITLDLFVSSYQKLYGSSKARVNIKPQKAIVELDLFYDGIKETPHSSIRYYDKNDNIIRIGHCFTTMEEAVEHYNECLKRSIESHEEVKRNVCNEINAEIDKINKLKL